MKRRKYRYKKENRFKQLIIEHIKDNIKDYIIISTLFIIGIIIGVVFINNQSENQTSIIEEYINNAVDSIKTNTSVNNFELLFTSLKQNIFFISILWISGLIILGPIFIYVIIVYRGFILGYTISSVIYTLGTWKGILFSSSSMLIQNLIFIPTLFFVAISGKKLINILYSNVRNQSIKTLIIKHTLISIIGLIFFIISSILEVFISRQILSTSIKWI